MPKNINYDPVFALISSPRLQREWKKKERVRIGLTQHEKLPETIVIATFNHDDIIAATDFGTWKEVLINAHHTSNSTRRNDYLWPKSMGKVFKKVTIQRNR